MKLITGANQMSLIRDTEECLKFLEFVGRKSILNEHAVNCRLTACNNLFSVLNEEEDSIDYILGNLDLLINRFRNKNNNVRASTLKVYKSRVKSSLEDYQAWSADPFAWERAITDKAKAQGLESRKEKKPKPSTKKAKNEAPEEDEAVVDAPGPVSSKSVRQVSFPIRKDFSIEMNLPAEGLTLKELHRIGLFLFPYCIDADHESVSPWPVTSPLSH